MIARTILRPVRKSVMISEIFLKTERQWKRMPPLQPKKKKLIRVNY